jgi:acetyltransferase
LARFAQIDYSRHVALLAEVFQDGRECMIAEARYVVDPGDGSACEFAVAVADDWQGLGLASALLDRLERQAAACGVRRIVGETLATNTAMMALARRRGFAISPAAGDPTLARLEKVVAGPVAGDAVRSAA